MNETPRTNADGTPSPSLPGKDSSGTNLRISPLGGMRRRGRWSMKPRIVSVTLVGGVNLDLTEVTFPAPVVTVTKVSLVGGVSLTVPEGTTVEVSGLSLFGGRKVQAGTKAPGAPTVRVRAFGVLGGVDVRRG